MLRRLSHLLLLGAFVSSISCGGSAAAPTPLNIPFSTTDLIVGTGTEVKTGTLVQVSYVGYLYSTTAADHKGTQFDSSTTSGFLVYQVGDGSAIPGMDQGLIGMKVSGRRQIVIPPELGYGAAGKGPIPPNATLLFIVDLLQAQAATASKQPPLR